MYMWMGFLLLSDCRKSSCAMTRLATPSSIWKEENNKQRHSLLHEPDPLLEALVTLAAQSFCLPGSENPENTQENLTGSCKKRDVGPQDCGQGLGFRKQR